MVTYHEANTPMIYFTSTPDDTDSYWQLRLLVWWSLKYSCCHPFRLTARRQAVVFILEWPHCHCFHWERGRGFTKLFTADWNLASVSAGKSLHTATTIKITILTWSHTWATSDLKMSRSCCGGAEPRPGPGWSWLRPGHEFELLTSGPEIRAGKLMGQLVSYKVTQIKQLTFQTTIADLSYPRATLPAK